MVTETQALNIIEQNLVEEIEIHPTWPDLLNRLGQLYSFRGIHHQAIEYYEKAIEINSMYKKPYLNKAFSLLKLDRTEDALLAIKEAPLEFTNDFLWLGPTGMVFMQYRDFNEARGRISSAIEYDPLNALWYHHRGIANWYLGIPEKAKYDLAEAMRQCPVLADYLKAFDVDLNNLRNDSINRYLKQFEFNRSMALVCTEIGLAFFTNEQFEDADRYFERALKIDLNLSAYYTQIGQMHTFQSKDQSALEYYQKAVSLNPRNVKASMLLADEEALRGNIDTALKIYEELVINFPKFADLRYNYGVLCSDAGYHDEAIEQFKPSLEINPSYLAPRISLAFCLLKSNQFKQSLEVYQRIIEQGVESADIYLQVGIIYRHLQKFEQACASFEKAYQIDPAFPSILYHWGLAYYENDDLQNAKEKWQKYLQEDAVGEFSQKVEEILAKKTVN